MQGAAATREVCAPKSTCVRPLAWKCEWHSRAEQEQCHGDEVTPVLRSEREFVDRQSGCVEVSRCREAVALPMIRAAPRASARKGPERVHLDSLPRRTDPQAVDAAGGLTPVLHEGGDDGGLGPMSRRTVGASSVAAARASP